MTIHAQLLRKIKERSKSAEFNQGILTADRYAQTLLDCVGSNLCERYAAAKASSFDFVLKRAAETLTYNNPEMVTQEIYGDVKKVGSSLLSSDEIEVPKNALMVFRHVLTTPRKDRDGDILRTAGARLDPKMLLLWQHVHTMPIGKLLGVTHHDEKRLEVVSAIVDINELAHDAAVMVDNGMGRFSHGFKALSYIDMKETGGQTTGKPGFDVKSFEILEESLVSVPANVDASTSEVLLDLIEGDKLTSSMMKAYGRRLRSDRTSISVSGGLPDGIDVKCGNDGSCSCGRNGKKREDGRRCGGTPVGSSEETQKSSNDEVDDFDQISETDKMKKKKKMCPECQVPLSDGVCPECGWMEDAEENDSEEEPNETKKSFGSSVFVSAQFVNSREFLVEKKRMSLTDFLSAVNSREDVEFERRGTKAGRSISNSNREKLESVYEGMGEIKSHCSTSTGQKMCDQHRLTLKGVITSGVDDFEIEKNHQTEPEIESTRDRFSKLVAGASPIELKRMLLVLKTITSARIVSSARSSSRRKV